MSLAPWRSCSKEMNRTVLFRFLFTTLVSSCFVVLLFCLLFMLFAWAVDNCGLAIGVSVVLFFFAANFFFICLHVMSHDDISEGTETSYGTRMVHREREAEKMENVEDLLGSFPFVSYTIQGVKSEHCAICLDDFVEGATCWVIPSCEHMFHHSCIERWLMVGSCCPLCRGTVSPV